MAQTVILLVLIGAPCHLFMLVDWEISTMEFVLVTLGLLAVGAGIVGWLWITAIAFSEGEVLWGVGCLLISPVCLVYGFMNFEELKIPFLLLLGGFLGRLAVVGIAMSLGA